MDWLAPLEPLLKGVRALEFEAPASMVPEVQALRAPLEDMAKRGVIISPWDDLGEAYKRFFALRAKAKSLGARLTKRTLGVREPTFQKDVVEPTVKAAESMVDDMKAGVALAAVGAVAFLWFTRRGR